MHMIHDPTQRTYATLQAAVRHFNEALFEDTLPPCLVGLLWGDRPVKPAAGGKRAKYVCPEDGIAAWARPGVRLICGEHGGAGVAMTEITPGPA